MINWLSKNFWLKIIALSLAVILWFYADVEVKRAPGDSRSPFWMGYAQENMIKEVQIVPAISGVPAEGRVMDRERIVVKPAAEFIIGPKRIIEKVNSLKTVQINITGQSKTYTLTVPLESIKGVRFYGAAGVADVTIPIEKSQQ